MFGVQALEFGLWVSDGKPTSQKYNGCFQNNHFVGKDPDPQQVAIWDQLCHFWPFVCPGRILGFDDSKALALGIGSAVAVLCRVKAITRV